MFDIEKLTKYKCRFNQYTELRMHRNDHNSFTYYDGKIVEQFLPIQNSGGVSARVFKNGAYGYSSLPCYSDEAISEVLSVAKNNAELIGRYTRNNRKNVLQVECGKVLLDQSVTYLNRYDIKALIEDLVCYCNEKYPSVKVESLSVNIDSCEKLLVVSNGFDSHSIEWYATIDGTFSRACINRADVLEVRKEYFFTEALSSMVKDMRKLYSWIDTAIEELKEKSIEQIKEPVEAEVGEFECVLSQHFAGILAHEAVGHTMEADSVITNDSVGSQYLGQQVASPLVSLTDFPHTAYGKPLPVRIYVDDEGVLCREAEIIKDGVLLGTMNNRYTAEILGESPTGNARASLFSDEPIIRMRNTCFLPGDSTLDEMIASIDKGYYFKTASGGNGGPTGKFCVYSVEAYEICKGKMGRAIYPTVISGHAWDVLKTVDMVSSDFRVDQQIGMCGKKQIIPTISGGPEMKLRLKVGEK